MTVDNSTVETVVAETPAETPVVDTAEAVVTGEDLQAQLDRLQAEFDKNKVLLKKVRAFERENKEAADAALQEQGKYKELYEAELTKRNELETKISAKLIDGALTSALSAAKVKAVSTVMKLIDKSKITVENDEVDISSIQAQLKDLKLTDPILFDTGEETPAVKRATEGTPVGGYEKELRGAKSQKEIEAVMRKYHKR